MFKSFTDPEISITFANESTNVFVVIQLKDDVSHKMHGSIIILFNIPLHRVLKLVELNLIHIFSLCRPLMAKLI